MDGRLGNMHMEYDVIVIGSGAIAGAIAFELADRGKTVCRVGPIERESSASGAAGAMNGCFGEVTGALLGSQYGTLKLQMDRLARNQWRQWAQRLAQASDDNTPLFTAQGTHVVLNTAGMADVDTVNFEAIEHALKECAEPYEVCDPGQIQWLKPDDQVRPLRSLYIPHEHAVNAHLLLSKLDLAAIARGATLKNEMARRVLIEGGGATGVELASGECIAASQVVVAAGVHSLDLLQDVPHLNRIPPLFAGYGVSLLVRPAPGCPMPDTVIRTPNRAFACGLHCVPRADGVLYLGATNILAEEPRSQALVSDVQFLLDCAVEQLNLDLHSAQILSIQVGNRPIPADGFPLIGNAGVEGLWLATGTYRDGLHQSPLIAAYIANALTGTANELDLSDFNPVRKPLAAASRSETVKETVRQMFATGHEYRWNIKPYWLPILDESMNRNYQALVQSLHRQFTPPAELVAFSWLYPSMRQRLQTYYGAWS